MGPILRSVNLTMGKICLILISQGSPREQDRGRDRSRLCKYEGLVSSIRLEAPTQIAERVSITAMAVDPCTSVIAMPFVSEFLTGDF